MKALLVNIILCMYTFSAIAQLTHEDKHFLYRKVVKNHISLLINKELKDHQKDVQNGYLDKIDFDLIPDSNEYFNISFESVAIHHQLTGYTLYEVRGFSDRFVKLYGSDIKMNGDIPYLIAPQKMNDNLGLIAYDKKNRYVIFLSGPFFLSDFKDYYFNNSTVLDMIQQYVQLRYYVLKPTAIKCKKDENAFFFSFTDKDGLTKTGRVFFAKPRYIEEEAN